MGERDNNDMIFYIIAGLVVLVLINLAWKWFTGGYVDAIKELTPMR
jgi:uncharacterized YccA/Bax inhibitor family protein